MATTKKTTTAKRAAETGSKAPQDRLPKAEAEGAPISLRFRGIDLLIDPDDLDDYEAASLMRMGLPDRMLEAAVPDDATRGRLVETCREDNGRLRLSAVVTMTTELLQAVGAGN